ncbi:hypothetical protein BaRGS_00035863 [Batillaria attramentaria]|uniref:Uncharacterized protein n=1 Tax=Batillaria attramentaria TaxID=370345 RepID=A0ABD0JDP4_9CAEN
MLWKRQASTAKHFKDSTRKWHTSSHPDIHFITASCFRRRLHDGNNRLVSTRDKYSRIINSDPSLTLSASSRLSGVLEQHLYPDDFSRQD